MLLSIFLMAIRPLGFVLAFLAVLTLVSHHRRSQYAHPPGACWLIRFVAAAMVRLFWVLSKHNAHKYQMVGIFMHVIVPLACCHSGRATATAFCEGVYVGPVGVWPPVCMCPCIPITNTNRRIFIIVLTLSALRAIPMVICL
jgi:hypothetical protein